MKQLPLFPVKTVKDPTRVAKPWQQRVRMAPGVAATATATATATAVELDAPEASEAEAPHEAPGPNEAMALVVLTGLARIFLLLRHPSPLRRHWLRTGVAARLRVDVDVADVEAIFG